MKCQMGPLRPGLCEALQTKRANLMVTADHVLHGALYALEQCGLLLRDAAQLYNTASYATAVVLGAFAREELGRERILLGIRQRILQGEDITVERIKEECSDHVEKQEASMLSIQLAVHNPDTQLAKILRARMSSHPQSQEWKDADAQLEKIDKQMQRRTPQDRHAQRTAALYVEPRSEQTWNRPIAISQLVAHDFLQWAINDYAGEHERRTVMRVPDTRDAEIFDAIARWPNRPELPTPGLLRSPWPEPKPATQVDTQRIRERAYAIWESEGRLHGNDLAHWFHAEHELSAGSR
jgi:AbiV family abortive infection protein